MCRDRDGLHGPPRPTKILDDINLNCYKIYSENENRKVAILSKRMIDRNKH